MTEVERAHAAAKEEYLVEWDRMADPSLTDAQRAQAKKNARAAWGRYRNRCKELQEYMDNLPSRFLAIRNELQAHHEACTRNDMEAAGAAYERLMDIVEGVA